MGHRVPKETWALRRGTLPLPWLWGWLPTPPSMLASVPPLHVSASMSSRWDLGHSPIIQGC